VIVHIVKIGVRDSDNMDHLILLVRMCVEARSGNGRPDETGNDLAFPPLCHRNRRGISCAIFSFVAIQAAGDEKARTSAAEEPPGK
jgi:hypothetical protein